MNTIDIQPVARPFRKTIRIPGSKSITNRALPLAALAEGETTLTGVLFADDTWQMMSALQALGYHLTMDQANATVRITGRGKNIPTFPGGITLTCGNSGTTIRFLAAMLSLANAGEAGGHYILDGVPRMRERPIDQLVDQLKVLGADISYDIRSGFPPIRINAKGLAGGGCQFADAKSSQYISAVLMAAPLAENPVTVSLLGPVTSEPYVVMTLRMMEQFGVSVQVHDQCGKTVSRIIQIPTASYKHRPEYAIEPDASNASYFLAAAAITPGSSITIDGLSKNSLQGDVAFADVLHKMGAQLIPGDDGSQWTSTTVAAPADRGGGKLHGIDIDMNHIPDMVQTLAVVALFAEGPTTIRNVWNLRVKETDRLAALENELKKLGAAVVTGKDFIAITPPPKGTLTPASIATYDDHRMAMSFAIAGLRSPGIRIENPACTAKTYPHFFQDLRAAVDD
jgi:3-phosphoshikimate 1-carboxyvinyltransferase